MIYISLTTTPDRFNQLELLEENLLSLIYQHTKKDYNVILSIPNNHLIPDRLLEFGKNHPKLVINNNVSDYGHITNIVGTISYVAADNDDTIIVCSDDYVYEPSMLEYHMKKMDEYPYHVICFKGEVGLDKRKYTENGLKKFVMRRLDACFPIDSDRYLLVPYHHYSVSYKKSYFEKDFDENVWKLINNDDLIMAHYLKKHEIFVLCSTWDNETDFRHSSRLTFPIIKKLPFQIDHNIIKHQNEEKEKLINELLLDYTTPEGKASVFYTERKILKKMNMKETSGKFIVFLTGPIVKYRLDIMYDACPNARDHLIFLTTKDSYDFYKDYHDFFNFMFLDDLRTDFPLSHKYEIFPDHTSPEFSTIEGFAKNIKSFYTHSRRTFFPYEAHRFILPYLAKHNILNFAIIDSDFILSNDFERLEEFFKRIPPGFCYHPFGPLEDEGSQEGMKRKMWAELQPRFPQINLTPPTIRRVDGYMRGFHFRNKDELLLFFDIWNAAVETCFTNDEYFTTLIGNNRFLFHFEWVIGNISSMFEYQFGYKYVNCHEPMNVAGMGVVGIHVGRPEDTFYRVGPDGWGPEHPFDHSDLSSISAFIKNNKPILDKYYKYRHCCYEITDTHVFTRTP